MTPELVVQRQLDAYNARDLQAFVAQYRDDVQVFRLPAVAPVLSGKPAFADFYAQERFNLPALEAQILNRIVMGNKVIDHERISGVRAEPFDAVAVYQVIDGLISAVWFFAPD